MAQVMKAKREENIPVRSGRLVHYSIPFSVLGNELLHISDSWSRSPSNAE